MKKDIHPEYVDCTVTCTCGNTFQTRSTKSEIRVDICNACHPFFTGTQKLIDSGGRVQRFANKFGSATEAVAAREAERRLLRLLRLLKQKQQRRLSVKLRLQQRLLVLLSTQRRLRLKLQRLLKLLKQRLQKLQPKKQQKLLQRKLLLRHLLKPQKTLQNNKAFS